MTMTQRHFFLLFVFLSLPIYGYSIYAAIISVFGNNFRVTITGCEKRDLISTSKQLSLRGYENKNLFRYGNLMESIVSRRHMFIINLNCGHSYKFLEQANKNRLYLSPFRWLVFYEKEKLKTPLEENLLDLSILVDSDFTLAEKYNTTIIFRKIFKKRIDSPSFELENVGNWTKELGFKKNETGNFKKRQNLGITLRASIVVTNNDTLNHLTDKRDKHKDSITKVNYVLVLTAASLYNISLNFSVTDSWGYKTNNSEWTGMVGELIRGDVDIGGTSLFFTKERVDFIEYVAMISPTKSKFVFRQPKLSYVTNVYTLPFDSKVWVSIIALVFLMMISLFCLMKWESTKTKFIQLHMSPNNIESLSDVAFVTVGAICQQGAASLPISIPGRIATLFLFLSLMFIYVSYSANIVALLQTSSSSIRTLEDLLKSRIDLGVDDTVFNRVYFRAASEPVRKAIYEKKVVPPGKSPNFMHIEDGVKKMREGLFAFHMETGAGYKLVSETFKEDEKCGLQEIDYLQTIDPWLAIQKNSSYKEILKIGLRLLHETGIQQRENILIYTRKPTCASKGATFFSVGIVDCYPAAAILAGGISVALAIFLIELYIQYRFDTC